MKGSGHGKVSVSDWRSEENNERPRSEQSVFLQVFELGTSRIRSRSTNYSAATCNIGKYSISFCQAACKILDSN
jgi:hypothetical protein